MQVRIILEQQPGAVQIAVPLRLLLKPNIQFSLHTTECSIGNGPYAIKMISEGTAILNIAHLFH